jgi:hypothetical protein
MLLTACARRKIKLSFENETTFDSVNITVYQRERSVKSFWIKRKCADCFTTFNCDVSSDEDTFIFVNRTLNMVDSCTIESDSITEHSFVLISATDFVMKKGYEYNGKTLAKDSLIRNFFCNIYY